MENIQNLLNQVAIINQKHEEILDATGGRFNMFRVCGVNHYENTHSAIIAEFLNPKGSHGLKSKLLECFIETLGNDFVIDKFNCENANVITEHAFNDGRMDIVIIDNQRKAIIIENKIYADDQPEQLKRYDNYAVETYKKGNYQILYLTLSGDDASEQSGQGVEYLPISHKETIIKWLDKCVSIAARFPMVRETINQYINHLKQLTNQDMDTKHKEDIILLLSKTENIGSMFSIGEIFDNVKNHLAKKMFLTELTAICKELKLVNKSEEFDYVNTCNRSLKIENPAWKYFDIFFEFSSNKLRNLVYGVIIKPNVINNETYAKLIPLFQHKYEPRFDVFNSFPIECWGKDAMIAISNGEMSKIFKEEIEKILKLTKNLDM